MFSGHKLHIMHKISILRYAAFCCLVFLERESIMPVSSFGATWPLLLLIWNRSLHYKGEPTCAPVLISGFISWPLVFTGTIRVEGNEQQLAEASLLITVIGHSKKKKMYSWSWYSFFQLSLQPCAQNFFSRLLSWSDIICRSCDMQRNSLKLS